MSFGLFISAINVALPNIFKSPSVMDRWYWLLPLMLSSGVSSICSEDDVLIEFMAVRGRF